jgi:hypothetical protein
MDENTHRMWDITFKWIGLIGVLASAWWTVHKYREDKATEATKSEEARKREQDSFILQHQATLYFDASRAAATLATSKDAKNLHDARERFNQLYWGELVTVEDRRVELAMIAFQNCLLKRDKDKNATCERVSVNEYDQPLNLEKLSKDSEPVLENLSLEIGACTRTALKNAWKIEFGLERASTKQAITTCPYD